ncbi:2-amino-4-hydroxy-6-hydroxymethyldihydropteridine diphosphokinase [uncultured Thalassospira sp.]|uniref:2-amino-4-hydroxy-6- hydroxymethyldihydropteridine diphosphokinase n=1 Tax=uncultured Thalassospira sp. TaxID=404382 RepID=UPI0030D7E09E
MTCQSVLENNRSASDDAILIALGANLPTERFGAPADTVRAAIDVLAGTDGICVEKISSFYETAPVPVSDQPWYVNAVIRVETVLSPHDLLVRLHEIEADFGRVRVMRNEARVLDLDLIAYGRQVLGDDSGLIVPHPRLHERAFVLLPVRDVAGDWVHPVLQQSIASLVGALPEGQEIRQMPS